MPPGSIIWKRNTDGSIEATCCQVDHGVPYTGHSISPVPWTILTCVAPILAQPQLLSVTKLGCSLILLSFPEVPLPSCLSCPWTLGSLIMNLVTKGQARWNISPQESRSLPFPVAVFLLVFLCHLFTSCQLETTQMSWWPFFLFLVDKLPALYGPQIYEICIF